MRYAGLTVAGSIWVTAFWSAPGTSQEPVAPPPRSPHQTKPARPEMVLQLGQSGNGFSVALSPDGGNLLTADGDALRLWDTRTHELVHLWRSTRYGAMEATFTPDGKLIACIGGVGPKSTTLVFRDPKTGKVVRTLDCPGKLEQFVFAPDGRRMAVTGEGKRVDLLDAASGKRLRTLTTLKRALCGLSFSRDGRWLCIGDDRDYDEDPKTYRSTTARGQVLLVDTGTGRVIKAIPRMNAGALSPDGRLLFTAGQTLNLWDTKSWRVLKQVRPQKEDRGFDFPSFSPDGRFIVTGGGAEDGGTVMVREVPSLRVVRTFYVYWPHSIAFSRQSDRITIAAGHLHSEITLANLRTGKVLWQEEWTDDPLNGIALHPDGRTLAVGNGWYTPAGGGSTTHGHVAFWDLASGRLTRRFSPGDDRTGLSWNCVSQVRFSAEGKVMGVATGQGAGGFSLWSYPELKRLRTWDDEFTSEVRMALSPDGKTVVSWGDVRHYVDAKPATIVWNGATGKRRHKLAGTSLLATSPDGVTVLTGGGREPLRLWSAKSGRKIRFLTRSGPPVSSAAYSPDGRRLALGREDGSIELWDTSTYQLMRTLSGAHLGEVSTQAFSPDGLWLASAALTIKVWDLRAGRVAATLRGANGGIEELTFARGSTQVVAATGDRALHVWDRATGQLRVTLREVPSQDLDKPSQEWIAHTPEGYYLGSPGVERFIRWRSAGKLLPGSAFASEFHKPERVAAALNGTR